MVKCVNVGYLGWVIHKNGGFEDRVRNKIMCEWIDEEEWMLGSLNDKMMPLRLKGWFLWSSFEASHVVYLDELECWAVDNNRIESKNFCRNEECRNSNSYGNLKTMYSLIILI